MRTIWIAGVLHALVGGTLLFLCLHPLRDALDADALRSMIVGSAWQSLQGLALMVIAATTRARIASLLIAGGTAVSMAMLLYIIFSGERPPIIVLVPIGGAIAILGWVALLFTAPARDH
jgi:uncharacterized membrane protein YgdD (TMEM256/DUF423 family)